MEPMEVLKKLKNIEADKEFSRNSRILILNTPTRVKLTAWNIILKNLELGTSLALAGLLIFMIIGGFSAWKFFAPLRVANLDPAAMRAEAEAIDMQIQLANLNYNSVTAVNQSESTPQQKSNNGGKTGVSAAENINQTTPVASSTSLTVDSALQLLSE